MKFNSKINNKHKINLPKIKNLKLKFMNNLIVRTIKYVGFQLIIYIIRTLILINSEMFHSSGKTEMTTCTKLTPSPKILVSKPIYYTFSRPLKEKI